MRVRGQGGGLNPIDAHLPSPRIYSLEPIFWKNFRILACENEKMTLKIYPLEFFEYLFLKQKYGAHV